MAPGQARKNSPPRLDCVATRAGTAPCLANPFDKRVRWRVRDGWRLATDTMTDGGSGRETDQPAPAAAHSPEHGVGRHTSTLQIVLLVLVVVAAVHVARAVVLPVVLACIAGMTLSPLVRMLSRCHLPAPIAAALVVTLLVVVFAVGFYEIGRPGLAWFNAAPEHMSELRRRAHKFVPVLKDYQRSASAMSDLGASDAEKRQSPIVAVKDERDKNSLINWTGSLLVGAGETVVLIYLLLASGDLFLLKLVHVMPTLSDKKRAVDISREIQQSMAHYLFTVSWINAGLAFFVGGGLYFMGVPNAAMWGMLVAVLNFVPYFGPIGGIIVLSAVGFLDFDTLWKALSPPAWYLALHLVEANLVTPILLGRRFELNAVVIFVSLIFWMWMWGALGALLSVPILVSVKVICSRFKRLSPISELLAH